MIPAIRRKNLFNVTINIMARCEKSYTAPE
jgi:hypothetical protein